MRSQNVLFQGESAGDDPFEPPGRAIAERIARTLQEQGMNVTGFENWRDSGWSFDLTTNKPILQLGVANAGEPGLWLLQIADIGQPGVVARLFGARRADRSPEMLTVAGAVHRALLGFGFTGIQWRVDGYPDGSNCTPEPCAVANT